MRRATLTIYTVGHIVIALIVCTLISSKRQLTHLQHIERTAFRKTSGYRCVIRGQAAASIYPLNLKLRSSPAVSEFVL